MSAEMNTAVGIGETTEEDVATAIDVSRAMAMHPLAQRTLQKQMVTGDNRVYSAADVLGERLIRIANLLLAAVRDLDAVVMNVADNTKIRALLAFARLSLRADPFLWTEEVRTALAASMLIDKTHLRLPRHTISPRLLPSPAMWWTFETGITTAKRGWHGTEIHLDAILVRDAGNFFQVWEIGEIGNAALDKRARKEGRTTLPFVQGHQYDYGVIFPDAFEEEDAPTQEERRILESVLGMMAFLNSPYIPKSRQRLERSARREIARRGAEDLGEEISFITLRRPEIRRNEKEEEHPGADWKHQWIVSGHYRAQWYPSESARDCLLHARLADE